MKRFLWRALGATVLAAAAATTASAADPYPTKPIRIIVNTGPGGLVDVTTRLYAQQMTEYLKQQVIVENRPGGDGLIGIRAAKAAPADGYTLLASASTIGFQLAVREAPGYDLKDFTAIGLMGQAPFLLVQGPELPDKSLADFVTRAKASPDPLSYASAGVGTATHLGAAVFLQQVDVKMLHVPYKGNGPAMPDVMSGRVNMIFEAYGSGGSKIKAGQLKALGVTSASRLPALPNIPTFTEQGVPFTFFTRMYLVAPAGTPKDIVQRLSEAVRNAASSKALKDRFREDGLEVLELSQQQVTDAMQKEATDAIKLVNDLQLPKL